MLPAVDAYNDYHVKYHSVSGGSALSQSMKYAEAWLYGSLNIKPCLRPTFFVESDLNDRQRCSCTSLQTPYSPKLFEQQRTPISCPECNSNASTKDHNLVRGFATIRGGAALRRTLKQRSDRDSDPYDAVRRSRLSGIESWPARAKSHSPTQRVSNGCSPVIHRLPSPEPPPVQDGGRKSILDCNLNAYDLLGRGSESGLALSDTPELESDEDESDQNNRRATAKKKNRQTFGSKLKSKIRDSRAARITAQYLKTASPKSPADDVCIAGQKVRIFNSSPHRNQPSKSLDDGWISDSSVDSVQPQSSTLTNQSQTPKRPPRHKGPKTPTTAAAAAIVADHEAVYENCYQRTAECDTGATGMGTVKCCDIKSILKKPLATSSPAGVDALLSSSATTGPPDSGASARAITTVTTCSAGTASAPYARGEPGENFYSATFERNEKTARKVKKQVQFKGMQDGEAAEDESGHKSAAADVRSTSQTGYDIDVAAEDTRTITATTPVRSVPDDNVLVGEELDVDRDRPGDCGRGKLDVDNLSSIDGGDGPSSIASRVLVVECSSTCGEVCGRAPSAIVPLDTGGLRNVRPRASKSGE